MQVVESLDVLITKVMILFRHLIYSKVTSSNTSGLEAHADFFRLLMKGIFDPYVQNFDFLISNTR